MSRRIITSTKAHKGTSCIVGRKTRSKFNTKKQGVEPMSCTTEDVVKCFGDYHNLFVPRRISRWVNKHLMGLFTLGIVLFVVDWFVTIDLPALFTIILFVALVFWVWDS